MPARSVRTWKLIARSAADDREARAPWRAASRRPAIASGEQQPGQELADLHRGSPRSGSSITSTSSHRISPDVRHSVCAARPSRRSLRCRRAARRPSRAGCRARSAVRTAPSRARTARAAAPASSTHLRTARPRAPSRVGARKAARAACSQRRASGASSGSTARAARSRRRAGAPRARVVERAQHAGHVAQRRMLGAPLVERPARLAFEVDDDEVVLRQQHLAEVIVAVEAGLRRRARVARAAGDAPSSRRAFREHAAAPRRAPRRQACAARKRVERARGFVSARARPAATSSGRTGSGSKAGSPVRVASARCSSAVRRPSVCISAR